MLAILCNHEFDPAAFENFADDYAGYCPRCMEQIERPDMDEEEDPDGSGVPEFSGDFDGEDGEPDLDDYDDTESEEATCDDEDETLTKQEVSNEFESFSN